MLKHNKPVYICLQQVSKYLQHHGLLASALLKNETFSKLKPRYVNAVKTLLSIYSIHPSFTTFDIKMIEFSCFLRYAS